jgi:hypothetical protein
MVLTHTMPWGVNSIDSVSLNEPRILARYVSPTEWDRLARATNAELAGLAWTIAPSAMTPDRWDLKIINGHRYTGDCTLTYRRRPRDLKCTGWEPSSRSGTLDWTGTTASGKGTQFSNQMLGCVLRVSGDPAYHPESLAGMHPYKDEGLILSVAGTEKLYAWSPADSISYSGTRYVVTDYLDISPGMYTALLSGCEVWVSRLLGKNIEGATGLYGRDLRLAFEQDAMAPISGRRDSWGSYYSFWYLRPGVDGGTGGGGMGGDTGQCPLKPNISGGDAADGGTSVWDGGSASTVFGACG